MTEVWYRNPVGYMKECAEELVPNIAWDRGLLVKRKIDPKKFLEMNYSSAVDYRVLLIGDQGSAEFRRDTSMSNPTAVYPTWEYGTQTLNELEEMLDNPVGQNEAACKDKYSKADERPVFGQEHRVVVIRHPDAHTNVGRAFLRELSRLQEEYPQCIIHIHGSYGYRVPFGLGFGAGDVDSREEAAHGRVVLGNGKTVEHERLDKFQQWVHLVGMSTTDLSIPRNRCMFNIRTAKWAGEFFQSSVKFKSGGLTAVDPLAPSPILPTTTSVHSVSRPALPGDKIRCDSCSLSDSCKYYRDGGVCSIPGTESSKLASQFKTRDSDRIIDALGTLAGMQAARAEQGVADEQFDGGLDPETTKVIHLALSDGIKLAKLVNPALAAASATKIGVFINNGTNEAPVNGLVGGAVAALEASGVARQDITPEMVASEIARQSTKVIEATARG